MADSDVIRKLHVYRSLFQVNRAFALLTYNLDQLSITQVFKDDIPDEQNPSGWLGQLAEIQMEINRRLTENLHNMEHGNIKRLHRIVDMSPEIRALHFDEETPRRRRSTKSPARRKRQ